MSARRNTPDIYREYVQKSKLLSTFFLSVILLVVGFGLGFFANQVTTSHSAKTSDQTQEHRESGYTYINPLLECENTSNLGSSKLAGMNAVVETIAKAHPDQEISLYYRDLLNGPWYGFHEDAVFAPQSLFKLPTVIAYFKIAEENPDILQQTIEYQGQIPSNLPDSEQLTPGAPYTIELLIQRTLQLSDNVAFNLLVEKLPEKYLRKVHEDLNLPYPGKDTPSDFVSVREYSAIFRVLYNFSYLSRKYSERLLELLTKSDYPDGLVAGVPKGTLVSHKFGLKNPKSDGDISQLHDCGIVYHPERPYLICIMTKGSDQVSQSKTLQELAGAVYTWVNE